MATMRTAQLVIKGVEGRFNLKKIRQAGRLSRLLGQRCLAPGYELLRSSIGRLGRN